MKDEKCDSKESTDRDEKTTGESKDKTTPKTSAESEENEEGQIIVIIGRIMGSNTLE